MRSGYPSGKALRGDGRGTAKQSTMSPQVNKGHMGKQLGCQRTGDWRLFLFE